MTWKYTKKAKILIEINIKPLTLRKVIIIIITSIIVTQIRCENVESSKFNLFRECFIARANTADWQTLKLNKWKSRYSTFLQTCQDSTWKFRNFDFQILPCLVEITTVTIILSFTSPDSISDCEVNFTLLNSKRFV